MEACADAAAKAQAKAATTEEEVEAQQNQPPLLVIPLRAAAPDTPVPPDGGDQLRPAGEGEGGGTDAADWKGPRWPARRAARTAGRR